MKTSAILALTVIAGVAAAAQAQTVPTATVSLSWKNSGSTVAGATQNTVQMGESIDIWVNVSLTGLGGAVPTGILMGLGTLFMDVVATRAGTFAGSELPIMAGFGGTTGNTTTRDRYGRPVDGDGGWRTGPWVLNPDPISGMSVANLQAGQFPTPGSEVNPANPVNEIIRLRWTPANYEVGTVDFSAQKAAAATTGVQVYATNPSTGAHTSLNVEFANITWLGLSNIPIVPAPSSLALLGLGGLLVARRRR
jgi:hypothetical protein